MSLAFVWFPRLRSLRNSDCTSAFSLKVETDQARVSTLFNPGVPAVFTTSRGETSSDFRKQANDEGLTAFELDLQWWLGTMLAAGLDDRNHHTLPMCLG